MELYNFYTVIGSILTIILPESTVNARNAVLGGIIGAGVLWLVLFILQGIGIYTMAKRQGLKRKWLAFLPFGNIAYMGKLSGECGFFGHKMKNASIYAMIGQIVTSVLVILYLIATCYLYMNYEIAFVEIEGSISRWQFVGLTAADEKLKTFAAVCDQMLLPILGLISQLFMLVLLISLYKKYTPKNYFILAMLTVFAMLPSYMIPFLGLLSGARYIIIFKIRKREPIDYEAYMRKRQEEFIRRQQQYYQTYGNPYNRPPYNGNPQGPNSPYGMGGYQNGPTPPKQEDPFGEFTSEGKTENNDNSQSGGNEDADEFFN